uniref:Uncharacterized protein n=1 Tax=Nelumbo nucifera TaxID=4432 RepID=A0A822ZYQ8_NELNU|nr:TPA_asm: hypothetical protein HUJ06_018598 [Nelumbo nucifera]
MMDSRRCSRVFENKKWKLQAKILRVKCNFMRMVREVALKKLEKNHVLMEQTLRFAVESLIDGKKKMYEGKSVGVMLEEKIKDLKEKLEELQRISCIKDFEFRKCTNFDKQTVVIQRLLEKLDGISMEECVKEIQEMA